MITVVLVVGIGVVGQVGNAPDRDWSLPQTRSELSEPQDTVQDCPTIRLLQVEVPPYFEDDGKLYMHIKALQFGFIPLKVTAAAVLPSPQDHCTGGDDEA